MLVCTLSILVYTSHNAYPVKNGGTIVGLALGIAATLIILVLMTLGIRKRSYRSTLGTVNGWVASHIYLGVSLLIIGTLHTGFQLGANIHSLAWLLMCVVVCTGIWGITVYRRYPLLLNRNQRGQSLDLMLAELNTFDQQLSTNSSDFAEDIVFVIDESITGTVIGGNIQTQLCGHDQSSITLPDSHRSTSNLHQSTALNWLTTQLSESRDSIRGSALKAAIDGITYREVLLDRIRQHIAIQAKLKLWLIFHVPLSFALLAALLAHIVAVLVYM